MRDIYQIFPRDEIGEGVQTINTLKDQRAKSDRELI